ncbi:MAG TPA: transcription-repair coupling factor [Clostridiales bacterium]|nr:transcription-repair coupling factor [Clostridiales bacterium]
MQYLNSVLGRLQEYKNLIDSISSGNLPASVSGVSHIHKALIVSSVVNDLKRPACVIVSDESEAERLRADLENLGNKVLNFPLRDFTFRNITGYSREYEHIRIGTLSKMLEGDFDVALVCIDAACQATLPPSVLQQQTITIKLGQSISPEDIIKILNSSGYVHTEQVEGAGQYAKRGGILDIFTPESSLPVRIEFWGDEIDAISYFEVESQRRTENINQLKIVPAREVLFNSPTELITKIEQFRSSKRIPQAVQERLVADIESINNGLPVALDKYIPLAYDNLYTIFDYLKDCVLFVSDSAKVKERYKNFSWQLGEDLRGLFEDGILTSGLDRFCLENGERLLKFENIGAVYLESFARGSYETKIRSIVNFSMKQSSLWSGSLNILLEDIEIYHKHNYLCIILAGTERSAKFLAEELNQKNIPAAYSEDFLSLPDSGIWVTQGGLSAGLEIPQIGFSLISQGKTAKTPKRHIRRPKNTKGINSLEELKLGDYVVHSTHGIGIFDGIHKLSVEGVTKDYLKIKYAKQDVLYVPVTQLDLVSKYIGQHEDAIIKLNRLGSSDWQKTRSRVRAAVKDMAKELIKLYAKRMQTKGHAFSPDTDLQNDFERRFEHEETEDQLRCVQEIKADMERDIPMDRLLCGDVGFGKTEVALRAAFKCVLDGKQCAILVPTTILAWQHYQTLLKRIGDMPVRVELLSRFRSPKQQQEIIKNLRRGYIDIIVGTHRMISNDVVFKDLGLLIIDEEQRFGVSQKEKLKAMFPAVDVLTLTATPIPRTLNMALSGLRDISIIEEAPEDRHPVQTYVLEYDRGIILDAIKKELRRGGQVYYLHNRVESIEACAARLAIDLPECRIATAHGKMQENELSDVWRKLIDHEIDVLVCTTIIETGVDVSNVNTLIIEDADRMGLAQLHQLRGRVGRSPRRAYAYLCFKSGKALSDIATKRLDTIRQFTEFGSGLKIAIRDLEIRGAGNILGGEQHGHMEAVGYDLYLKLLADAIAEEKGEEPASEVDCTVDLRIDAHIPEDYISSLPQRLAIYRRIAEIRYDDDAADVLDELIDRFGEPPPSVKGLIELSLLRNRAAALEIYEVVQKEDLMLLFVSKINTEKVSKLASMLKGRVMLSAGNKPYISVRMKKGQSPIEALREVLDAMQK